SVCLRTGVGLDVSVLGAKEFFCTLDGESLSDIYVLTAAVVALAGVALGVLICKNGTLRLQHCARHEVFARDHFEGVALATKFSLEHGGDFGIELGKGLVLE